MYTCSQPIWEIPIHSTSSRPCALCAIFIDCSIMHSSAACVVLGFPCWWCLLLYFIPLQLELILTFAPCTCGVSYTSPLCEWSSAAVPTHDSHGISHYCVCSPPHTDCLSLDGSRSHSHLSSVAWKSWKTWKRWSYWSTRCSLHLRSTNRPVIPKHCKQLQTFHNYIPQWSASWSPPHTHTPPITTFT